MLYSSSFIITPLAPASNRSAHSNNLHRRRPEQLSSDGRHAKTIYSTLTLQRLQHYKHVFSHCLASHKSNHSSICSISILRSTAFHHRYLLLTSCLRHYLSIGRFVAICKATATTYTISVCLSIASPGYFPIYSTL
ncbi:hypothetical protein J6590_061664 [Homalodisca vitripennis]|nr:hypothetical protein J6590_061664 [Homalodisca vitripennis]